MTTTANDALLESLRAFVGQEATPVRHAQEPVNRPMIRHLVEAVGDENPVYLDDAAARATGRDGIVAPAPMLSTWLMFGYKAHMAGLSGNAPDNAMSRLVGLLAEHGYTGVVATNDDQTYHRELRPGDQLSMTTTIEEISPRKVTALGTGYFITTLRTYRDQNDEVVGEQRFRLLRFDPRTARPAAERPDEADRSLRARPFILQDNEFWFAAARDHRLVIQACSDCGRLRHPPAPACPHCNSFTWHEAPASGRGTVHSYVISHHPKAPGYDYPLAILLVDLEEGTRLVADFAGDLDDVRIGMPVDIEWVDNSNDLVLPRFRAAGEKS